MCVYKMSGCTELQQHGITDKKKTLFELMYVIRIN